MRVIGLDLGTKTLGISSSDLSLTIASTYKTINFNSEDYNFAIVELKKVIEELTPELLVLGLPKNMDGSLGFQAQKTLEFKELLEKETNLEVVLIDERLTSKMANSIMIQANLSRKKRKTKVDKLAATLILQSYLDSRKRETK
ncbi:Holliday junction resolvase RuvX [Mycoplasmatota bacterium WC30]